MEIEKVIRILAVIIGIMGLLLYAANVIFFDVSATSSLPLLIVFILCMVTLFRPRKKTDNNQTR